MKGNVDFSKIVPIEQLSGEDENDTRLLHRMAEDAKQFLLSFEWCRGIDRGWFGWGVGEIAAVLLFEITPSTPDVDRMLWVVVGDLPPAYLVVDDSPTPLGALSTYVELLEDWVAAVREGRSTEDCIPVNNAPTQEAADALETRLNFLKREFLGKGDSLN